MAMFKLHLTQLTFTDAPTSTSPAGFTETQHICYSPLPCLLQTSLIYQLLPPQSTLLRTGNSNYFLTQLSEQPIASN